MGIALRGASCPLARRRIARGPTLAALVLLPVLAGAAGDPPILFRVILQDGSALVSYGEYTRVGDRVVFTMPASASVDASALQVVNLPASQVDWRATEQYRDAVRYTAYAASRGEQDYRALTSDIAAALNELARTRDPVTRLEVAERARRTVADWPRTHYGYRSGDVREMLSLLDAAVSELRVAAGAKEFDLSLVALVEAPDVRLMPKPTPAEAIALVLSAARHSDVPADRLSLLRAALAATDRARPVLPKSYASRVRKAVGAAIDAETRVERDYMDLTRRSLAEADSAARKADVQRVAYVIESVRSRDVRLGQKRSEVVSALFGTLEETLAKARELRLARDRWALEERAVRTYTRDVRDVIQAFGRARGALEAIRSLAGPDARGLAPIRGRLATAGRRLSSVAVVPTSLAGPHATLTSALRLAGEAVRLREDAIRSGELGIAWDASSAAAGSMMLFARARDEMDAVSRQPELR
jgi:hypothetical protein